MYLQLRDEKVLEALVTDAEVTEVEGPKKKPSKASKKKKAATPAVKKKTAKGKKD